MVKQADYIRDFWLSPNLFSFCSMIIAPPKFSWACGHQNKDVVEVVKNCLILHIFWKESPKDLHKEGKWDEKKKKWVKDDAKCCGLRNWNNRAAISWNRRDWTKSMLGGWKPMKVVLNLPRNLCRDASWHWDTVCSSEEMLGSRQKF